jgi:SAM-dependent methyltransferase
MIRNERAAPGQGVHRKMKIRLDLERKRMSDIAANTCIACLAEGVEMFLEIPQVPVLCNVPADSPEDALRIPRRDIQLAFCPSCGHMFNLAFQPELVEYGEEYENSLYFSPFFQNEIQALAEDLIERYQLHGKRIVEIGCGQGDFLKLLVSGGRNTGVGFDPSYVRSPGDTFADSRLEFIRDYYSEQYVVTKVDFLCSRHVLEHIADPRAFLTMVRRSMGSGRRTAVFFEVPNGLFMLRDLSVWDILYEHRSYFTAPSLVQLFEETGFQVCRLTEAFNGQFLRVEACPGGPEDEIGIDLQATRARMKEWVEGLSESYRSRVEQWRAFGRRAEELGQRVVVWGGGSKGVTFMNKLHSHIPVGYVIDVNPRKWGKYITGTGHKIVPPSFLAEYRPDIVIVMNPIYEAEIRETLLDLNIDPEPELMIA